MYSLELEHEQADTLQGIIATLGEQLTSYRGAAKRLDAASAAAAEQRARLAAFQAEAARGDLSNLGEIVLCERALPILERNEAGLVRELAGLRQGLKAHVMGASHTLRGLLQAPFRSLEAQVAEGLAPYFSDPLRVKQIASETDAVSTFRHFLMGYWAQALDPVPAAEDLVGKLERMLGGELPFGPQGK